MEFYISKIVNTRLTGALSPEIRPGAILRAPDREVASWQVALRALEGHLGVEGELLFGLSRRKGDGVGGLGR